MGSICLKVRYQFGTFAAAVGPHDHEDTARANHAKKENKEEKRKKKKAIGRSQPLLLETTRNNSKSEVQNHKRKTIKRKALRARSTYK